MLFFKSIINNNIPLKVKTKAILNNTLVTLTKCGKKNNIMRLNIATPPVNSLNLNLIQEIKNNMLELNNNNDIKAIIISSGINKIYCAGLDLNELYNSNELKLFNFWQNFQEMLFSIYSNKKMIISEIKGVSVAGGCMISMCCDYRIGLNNADNNNLVKIGLNEAAFGLVAPYFACDMMEDLIGKKLTYEACNLGLIYNCDEALKIGLIDKVNDINENIEDISIAECEKWMRAPGRLQTKELLRQNRLNKWKSLQEQESKDFVHRVLDSNTQLMIGNYLASLSKKK